MDNSDILYNYLEFFFTTDDLHDMIDIKSSSYKEWSESVLLLKEENPPNDYDTKFYYNIRWTSQYIRIKRILDEMDIIIKNEKGIRDVEIKQSIRDKILKIKELYIGLEYYEDIYVYAHHIFNSIRDEILNSVSLFSGGGITLEEFKEIIRQKVKLINN